MKMEGSTPGYQEFRQKTPDRESVLLEKQREAKILLDVLQSINVSVGEKIVVGQTMGLKDERKGNSEKVVVVEANRGVVTVGSLMRALREGLRIENLDERENFHFATDVGPIYPFRYDSYMYTEPDVDLLRDVHRDAERGGVDYSPSDALEQAVDDLRALRAGWVAEGMGNEQTRH